MRTTNPSFNGCAAFPTNRPSAVVASIASEWTLGHEVGHVLGLPHVTPTDRLMTGGGTNNITNPPSDLVASEVRTDAHGQDALSGWSGVEGSLRCAPRPALPAVRATLS